MASENDIKKEKNELEDENSEYWKKKYFALVKSIKKEFPNFKLINKGSSKFSQMLGRLVFWNKEYNSHYITTIGPKIYVNSGIISTPKNQKNGKNTKGNNKKEIKESISGKNDRNLGWSGISYKRRYGILLHERIHIRQESKFGLIVWTLIYMLVPLPAMLAYFRRKWESEAYEIDIYRAYKEKGRKYILGKKYMTNLLNQFCGPFYFFTWYKKSDIYNWVVDFLNKIDNNQVTFKMLVNRRRRKGSSNFDVPKLLKWIYPEEFK